MSEHGPQEPSPAELSLVRLAIAEDLPRGDATSLALLAPGERARAAIVAREAAVVAGLAPAFAVFREIEPRISLRAERDDGSPIDDGARVQRGDTIVKIEGHALAILAGERTALNFLGRLSGIATVTRALVDAVEGTGARILDTRKTTPGWRSLEKAAVRAGGGENHRMDASSMILVKDNHRELLGGIAACLDRLGNRRAPAGEPGGGKKKRGGGGRDLPVEVEADSLDEVRALIEGGIERILLDNMDIDTLKRAVALARGSARPIFLEASGGITLQNVRSVAESGVDGISVGAVTHSARSVDLSLEIVA